jgi:glycine betaine/proline transport system substrate-binding protein
MTGRLRKNDDKICASVRKILVHRGTTVNQKLLRNPLFVVALLLGVTACGAVPPANNPTPSAMPSVNGKPIIRLAQNPWTGSAVNAHVAKQLLEEKLGYTAEIVSIDENSQWAELSKGALSASLEVWGSGELHQKALQKYVISEKSVHHIGELGVVGKISWYVPKYVVDERPELASWQGFKKSENIALFKTDETGDSGQFLTGDPTWAQYDEEIIKNLGLKLKVVRKGSEQALIAALDAAYEKKLPILFYFWTPHSIHKKYQLVQVKLPEYSTTCYSERNTGKKNCDYPPDRLFKIANAKLRENALDAYTLLANMRYSTEDQITMISDVELNNKLPEEAARAWIAANEKVWRRWLPTKN